LRRSVAGGKGAGKDAGRTRRSEIRPRLAST
jgi:hypothetical protein